MALYAQTSGTQSTNTNYFVPIPGLIFTLPEGDGVSALIILNVPNPYAQGDNFPGGNFGLAVNGTNSDVTASFSYNEQAPQAYGRVPTTLVISAPLIDTPQVVVAVWSSARGSTVMIDSPATLSAIID